MKIKVLMFGTKAKGGMTTIVNSYLDSELSKKYSIKYIPTHIETNIVLMILYFGWSLIKALIYFLNPRYKIVHLHASRHGSIMRKSVIIMLSKLFGKKIIIHMHGADFFVTYQAYGSFMKRFVSLTLNSVDALVATSKKRKEEFSQFITPDKIFVIQNFMSVPAKKGQSENKPVKIISLGRLGKRKGTGDLIRAIINIKHLDFTVEIGGDGDVDFYKEMVEKAHLNEKVKILGWVTGEDKINVLKTGDIFILPTYFEDMPLAILEAMSYQMPVISTNVAGIPEMVEDGKSGFIVEAGDVDSLTEKLTLLIKDENVRYSMGERSYQIIKEKFSSEVVFKKIIALYERLGNYSVRDQE